MGNKYPNRLVINVRSPKNESACIRAYKELNPKANKKDGLDVSAVKTINGERGYALMSPENNRSRDKSVHRGQDFISKKDIDKQLKK